MNGFLVAYYYYEFIFQLHSQIDLHLNYNHMCQMVHITTLIVQSIRFT